MNKFVIRPVASGFKFDLYAPNGEAIATSEVYDTRAACRKGLESVRKNAPAAKTEDLADPQTAPLPNPKFELFQDKTGATVFACDPAMARSSPPRNAIPPGLPAPPASKASARTQKTPQWRSRTPVNDRLRVCPEIMPHFPVLSSRGSVSEARDLRTGHSFQRNGNAKILRRASLAQDDTLVSLCVFTACGRKQERYRAE